MKGTDLMAAHGPQLVGTGSATVDLTSNDATFTADDYPRSLAVFAAGDVKFDGVDGRTDTWTIPAAASFPFLIPVAVKKVWRTGTTVAAGNIKAIF